MLPETINGMVKIRLSRSLAFILRSEVLRLCRDAALVRMTVCALFARMEQIGVFFGD